MMFASYKRMDQLLVAGLRFFPTDEELISCYLARKAMDASFTSPAIRDLDLYKSEPWDLMPCEQQAAAGGPGDLQQEGYFFCRRGSSKYPSGVRARRATRCGYWKSTGKDRAVHGGGGDDGRLVGTRKTLVFYHRGRAPRGEKTGWVMHEYAMGERSCGGALLRGAQSEWVICKVFMRKHRTSDGRKLTSGETMHDEDSTPGHLVLPMAAPDGSDGELEAAAPLVVTDSLHTVSHSDGAHAMQMEPDDAGYYLPELLEYDGCEDLPNAGLGLLETGAEAVNRRAEITSTAIGPLHLDGLYWKFGF